MARQTRRGFLGRLVAAGGVIGFAGHATVSSAMPDAFQYRGWDVRWRNWVETPDQLILIGVWYAIAGAIDRARPMLIASTTLGTVGHYHEMDCIDCTRMRGVPLITPHSTETQRQQVKAEARQRLLAYLETL